MQASTNKTDDRTYEVSDHRPEKEFIINKHVNVPRMISIQNSSNDSQQHLVNNFAGGKCTKRKNNRTFRIVRVKHAILKPRPAQSLLTNYRCPSVINNTVQSEPIVHVKHKRQARNQLKKTASDNSSRPLRLE